MPRGVRPRGVRPSVPPGVRPPGVRPSVPSGDVHLCNSELSLYPPGSSVILGLARLLSRPLRPFLSHKHTEVLVLPSARTQKSFKLDR